MKLEVGQFVRLKSGYICKIININDFREPNMKYGVEANYLKDVMFIGDDDVVKASYNITDILEVGDAIEIDVIDKDNYPTIMGINFARIDNKVELASIKDMLKNESAKLLTVITHEQMEQMAYKVGE